METTQEKAHLKRRTLISTISLFFQSGYSAALGLIANLVLTILLTPTIFGIYMTVLSLISLLNYFSDIGLAASLIQKKEVTDDDVKTTFTIQQILVVTIVTIGFFMTSFVKNFYHLPQEGVYLFWALLISFFISSLKTIPSIFLERKVHFQKIVLVQIIENTVFYIAVSVLALMGMGLQSFTFAVLLRAITGLIVIYSISFWLPRFGISKKSMKVLLSFGLPFQASSFLALFKDDLITLFLSKLLGFEGLGYIGWAKKWAETPLRIIMDNLSRVLFPILSRIQDDKPAISRLIEKILYFQTLLLAPATIGLAIVMSSFVEFIPKYHKWAPALPIFYIFCLSSMLSSYSTPFMNMFNALGKVKISFKFMLFWTVATWVLTLLLTNYFKFYGFPLTSFILSSTFFIVVIQARKIIPFNFIRPVLKPLIASIVMGLVLLATSSQITPAIVNFGVSIVLGPIVFFGMLKLVFHISIINELKLLFKNA
jgi:O-antigen/teichoic acid export membrane protein